MDFNPQGGSQAAGGPRPGEPTAQGRGEAVPPPNEPSRDVKLIRGIVERLSDQLSRREVDPKVLADLGWTPEQVQAFVEKYKGRLDNRRPDPDRTELPTRREEMDAQPGTLKHGLGVDERLRVIRDREKKLDPDQLRRLIEPRRETVAPEYRELVEEYLKALSEAK